MSFAYQLPVPAVDGNAVRVIARLTDSPWTQGDIGDRKLCRQYLEEQLQAFPEEPDVFNEALIELGATLCVKGRPNCVECPLSANCKAREAGTAPDLPKPKPSLKKPVEKRTVLVIRDLDNREVIAYRRPDKGLLAALWDFPTLDGHRSVDDIKHYLTDAGLIVSEILALPKKRHVFSHLVWDMAGYLCAVRKSELILSDGMADPKEFPGDWYLPNELAALAFPTALSPYLESALLF